MTDRSTDERIGPNEPPPGADAGVRKVLNDDEIRWYAFDPNHPDGVAYGLVTALAAAEGISSTELDPVQGRGLDVEALTMLFASARDVSNISVTFTLGDHRVSVESDGLIVVEPRLE